MTPPTPIGGNSLLGRLPSATHPRSPLDSLRRLQQVSGVARELSASQARYEVQAGQRLLTMGWDHHRQSILTHPTYAVPSAEQEARLQEALGLLETGNPSGYSRSLRWLFVLIHHRLESGGQRAQARNYVNQFLEHLRGFQELINGASNLEPIHQFRYLHGAARIARTLLGRLLADETFSQEQSESVDNLRRELRNLYRSLQDCARRISIENVGEDQVASLLTDVQMRDALLTGNHSEARSLAWRLLEYYENHPLPAESEQTWVHRALREVQEDGLALQLVNSLHQTAPEEESAVSLNSLATELVVQASVAVDTSNEESEEVIQRRYRAFSNVMPALILHYPGHTLLELAQMLADPHRDEEINGLILQASQTHPGLAEALGELRRELEPTDLLETARDAAQHILDLKEGAGSYLLGRIFSEVNNDQYNRIRRLQNLIAQHPSIVRDLALSYDPQDFEGAALELLRSREVAQRHLVGYSRGLGPREQGIVRDILESLSQVEDTQETVNLFVERMLEIFQSDLSDQPDHIFLGIQGSLQILSQTQSLGNDVSISEENHHHISAMMEDMDSFSFGVDRAWGRLFSSESFLSIGAGILAAEFLPGVLLQRAGRYGGRLGRLVEAGHLTRWGHAVNGLASGTTMALVGTTLQHRHRTKQGLHTSASMWARDFGTSAAMNGVIFGTTLPFGAAMTRWLAPQAETGAQVAELSWRRALTLRASTAAFGGTVALGGNVGLRFGMTGEFTTSWDEVAENYMALVLFELGSAAVGRWRRRTGLRYEMRGTEEFQGMSYPEWLQAQREIHLGLDGLSRHPSRNPSANPTQGAEQRFPRFRGLWNRMSQGLAQRFNEFFTVLGPHRVQQINDFADAVVRENPELHHYRDYIRYQIALQEAAAPGSLRQILTPDGDGHYGILDTYYPTIRMDDGVPNLRMVQTSMRGETFASSYPPTDAEITAIQRHLQDVVPTQVHQPSILREITGEPGQILRVYLHPISRKVLSTHTAPDLPDGIRMDLVRMDLAVDPVRRVLTLPPTDGFSGIIEIPYGRILDFYYRQRSRNTRVTLFASPHDAQRDLPFSWSNRQLLRLIRSWNDNILYRTDGQTYQGEGATRTILNRIESGELAGTLNVFVEVGDSSHPQIILAEPGLSGEQLPRLPQNTIQLEGRINALDRTITLPPTSGMEGEGQVVLNLARGGVEIIHPRVTEANLLADPVSGEGS